MSYKLRRNLRTLRRKTRKWIRAIAQAAATQPSNTLGNSVLRNKFNLKFRRASTTSTASPTQENTTPKLGIASAVAFLPCEGRNEERQKEMKRKNRENAGEDAFLISNIKKDCDRTCIALAVADGVGGYAKYGIDSSETSWRMLENIKHFLGQTKCPKELLVKAYNKIVENKEVEYGGTTVCVAAIEKLSHSTMHLHVANLGDSGLLVIRKNVIVYRTVDQLLGFNFPRQLSLPFNPACTTPENADNTTIPLVLEKGDIIVLGSDGLFDNVFDSHIVEILAATKAIYLIKNCNNSESIEKTESEYQELAQEMADRLLQEAVKAAKSSENMTPFEEHALEWNKEYYGGKPDDCTVVVSIVH